MFAKHSTLNCRGHLVDLSNPIVMGIINMTPDSFYADSRFESIDDDFKRTVENHVTSGAHIIDIGGMSSRPGASVISPELEADRVLPAIAYTVKNYPNVLISIDSMQYDVIRLALEEGAHIVNDISAARDDDRIPKLCVTHRVPYILMHMKGLPKNMQDQPSYEDITLEIVDFFIEHIGRLRSWGLIDIILDPGFGFGKSLENNYHLLNELKAFAFLEYPILVGVSRKSMIYKLLDITPTEALPATSALHLFSLVNGARILRVHDVKEAVECIRLYHQLSS